MPAIVPKPQQLFLLNEPGRWHHPWPTRRAYDLGICLKGKPIPGTEIDLRPYKHLAIHFVFGNGTPEENLRWIREGRLDLTSLPCRILFRGIATISQAAAIFDHDYSVTVDPAIAKRFAAQPYRFETRWGSGVTLNIGPAEFQYLHNLIPKKRRPAIPLFCGRSRSRIAVAA